MTAPKSWYLTQTVTQIKKRPAVPAQVDQWGNDVYTSTSVTLTGVLWDPKPVTSVVYAGRMEITDREDHVTEFGQLFINDVNVDIAPTDEIVLDAGKPFEVLGPVERHIGSRTGIDYCMVTLRRVTG